MFNPIPSSALLELEHQQLQSSSMAEIRKNTVRDTTDDFCQECWKDQGLLANDLLHFTCSISFLSHAVLCLSSPRFGSFPVSLQLKILHTRVFGQFAVICTLLGVMGLKDMMDRQGKFVTESEVQERVKQMEQTRSELMDRLDYQAKQNQGRSSKK